MGPTDWRIQRSSCSRFIVVVILRCAVCDTVVDVSTPLSWKCPRATNADRHHVLLFENTPDHRVGIHDVRESDSVNPFLKYQDLLYVDALGDALGMSVADRERIISDADSAIARVGGTGFRVTPFMREDHLSDELGFSSEGGVWVKDETHNVAGSHKARHIFTELLHLLFVEHAQRAPWGSVGDRPPLAIASCGNAAIAAATLASSARWPISVFVPVSAAQEVLSILHALDADVVTCPRRDDDPPGDPCVHRFREAVANGAIPFGVQGTENAWCLDGGRTIGWEMTECVSNFDRVFVQVGGGAFASCVGSAFAKTSPHTKLHAVQAEGCAPLARAWQRALKSGGTRDAGARWSECMWPWESEPRSLADGILDDETYDWISVMNAMTDSGGSPVVASEEHVVQALALAHRATAVDVSPTGTAGLAGVLAMRHEIADNERIAVVFSGVLRR
jgi:threonine synthase